MPPLVKLGLVHNWPGKKNSELEIIFRIRASLPAGFTALLIDPLGYELDDQSKRKKPALIADGTLDVVINLHYINPKFFSGLSYTVNWNPIEYIISDPITGSPVPTSHLQYLLDCFRSHDRVLGAGSALLDQFIQTSREHSPGIALPDAELYLHTTIASNQINVAKPTGHLDESSFRVFYIGMNWEKMSTSAERKVRHEGLLELLDRSGRFSFFGLREQSGTFLWEGFAHYKGELPFDGGESIIAESKRCGASLILSTEQHRKSGVVSTRIFQACAAGTVIICDENPFVREHFGDAVLYFQYGATNRETADNILAQVGWIEQNWDEAQTKASQSQKIFREQFALEKQLKALCDQVQSDIQYRENLLNALSERAVAVHYLIRVESRMEIARLANNLERQNHRNIYLYLYMRQPLTTGTMDILREAELQIVEKNLSSAPSFTTGATVVNAAEFPEEYHLWYSEGFEWRDDHMFNLLAIAEQQHRTAVYTPYFASHTDLEDDATDTMRYFISGLNGGYSRLTEDAIEHLSIPDLPLGNLLIHTKALVKGVSSIPNLALFDCAGPQLLLREIFLERKTKDRIGFSPVISSVHVATQGVPHRAVYNEYDYFPTPWNQGRQRDRSLFLSLLGTEAIVSPEYSKYSMGQSDDASRLQNLSGIDPQILTEKISHHFSLGIYIQQILKNRPFLKRSFSKMHAGLARLLRLP